MAEREIRHLYQRRGFGLALGAPWSATPSEMAAFQAQPWWKRLGGAERHFRKLGRGLDQRPRTRPPGNSRTPRR